MLFLGKPHVETLEKHHVPRALMWHSSGYSIFSLYILGSLSSNQPHNYMIVTRLTELTTQKSWRSSEGPLPNNTFTPQLFLVWLDETVPMQQGRGLCMFRSKTCLSLLCVLKHAQLSKPRSKGEDWFPPKKEEILFTRNFQNTEKCKESNKHPCGNTQNC